jgi:hypothetical protein
MANQNPDLEIHEISEDQRIFIMELIIQIGEAIKKRNDSIDPRGDMADAMATAVTLLSIIYASCPEDQRENFKEAMKNNIDAL